MEGSVIDLSKYRYETAKDDLDTAKVMFRAEKYKAAINRSYYAIFHALRSVTALDGFDSSKHSGVIAYFNKNYVATGIFDREIGRNLARLKQKREQSDYDDFFIASKEEAQKQFDNAESIVAAIIEYMRKNNSGTII